MKVIYRKSLPRPQISIGSGSPCIARSVRNMIGWKRGWEYTLVPGVEYFDWICARYSTFICGKYNGPDQADHGYLLSCFDCCRFRLKKVCYLLKTWKIVWCWPTRLPRNIVWFRKLWSDRIMVKCVDFKTLIDNTYDLISS